MSVFSIYSQVECSLMLPVSGRLKKQIAGFLWWANRGYIYIYTVGKYVSHFLPLRNSLYGVTVDHLADYIRRGAILQKATPLVIHFVITRAVKASVHDALGAWYRKEDAVRNKKHKKWFFTFVIDTADEVELNVWRYLKIKFDLKLRYR